MQHQISISHGAFIATEAVRMIWIATKRLHQAQNAEKQK